MANIKLIFAWISVDSGRRLKQENIKTKDLPHVIQNLTEVGGTAL